MDRNTIIDTMQKQGGFITAGEVQSRGEYEQLRRATEKERLCGFVTVFMLNSQPWQIT